LPLSNMRVYIVPPLMLLCQWIRNAGNNFR
jgi:hypothetical protein